MESGRTLYYVNIFLKIILFILFIYMLFTAYQFIAWFDRTTISSDEFLNLCNLHASQNREYSYCCDIHQVSVKHEIVGSTCFGLRDRGYFPEMLSLSCDGLSCR